MARLTWQNVEAPNFSSAADMLNAAALQMSNGGQSIAGAFRNAREDQMDRRSAAALPILAGVQNSRDVAGALAQIDQVLRPEDMNEETRKAYLGLMGQGLDYDGSRARTDATRASTSSLQAADGRAQTEFDRRIKREDQDASHAGDFTRMREGELYPGDRKVAYRNSIAGIESAGSGGYSAIGVADSKLGRPLGAFQIMEANLPAWSKAALGREVSADEFLNNPDIQNAIFDHRFGSYVAKYGEENAARAWFGGEGAINNTGGTDVHGRVTIGDYGKQFMAGLGGHSTPGRVSSLIPEDNVLPSEYWSGKVDQLWNDDESGYQRERSREADAHEEAVKRQSDALYEQITRNVPLQEDWAPAAAASGQSPEVIERTLGRFGSADAQAQQALPFGAPTPDLPDAAATATIFDVTENTIKDVRSNDPQLRVQGNASTFGSEPAVVIAEKLGLATDDGKGWWVSKVDELIANAKDVNGNRIPLTPGEASSLLLESAGYAELFMSGVLPFGEQWGDTYADTSKALTLAKQYMSPEQKRAGAEKSSQVAQAETALSQLREDMGVIARGIQQAGNKDNTAEVERLQKMWDQKVKQVAEFEKNLSFLPKNPKAGGDETPKPGGGETPTTPTTQDPGATTAGGLETAISQIADQALQQATDGGIDLAGLQKADPATQERVLVTAIANLQQMGGSSEQIAVLDDLLQKVAQSNTIRFDDKGVAAAAEADLKAQREALLAEQRAAELRRLTERRDGAAAEAARYLEKWGRDNPTLIGQIGTIQKQIDEMTKQN